MCVFLMNLPAGRLQDASKKAKPKTALPREGRPPNGGPMAKKGRRAAGNPLHVLGRAAFPWQMSELKQGQATGKDSQN